MFYSIKNNSINTISISDMGLDIAPGTSVDINSSLYNKFIDSKDIISFLTSGDLSIIYDGYVLDINNSLSFHSRKFTPFFRTLTTDQMKTVTPVFKGEMIYVDDQDLSVFWNGTEWLKLDGSIFNPDPAGTGPAGTYNESFEDINIVLQNWYTPINFPIISNTLDSTTTGAWNIKSSSTPSSGTGPSGAQNGTYFIYAEQSSGANVYTYKLRTSYFNKLTTVSFYYNMTGSNIGTFKFNVYRQGNWENKYISSTDTGTGWVLVSLDLTGLNVEEIEFEYSGATGYQGDFCIDNVTITSV